MRHHWKRNALGPSLVLAAFLSIGLIALWGIFAVLTTTATFGLQNSSSYKQLVFTTDGEALLRTYPAGNRMLVEPVFHTLEGKRVTDLEGIEFLEVGWGEIPPADYKLPGFRFQEWSSRMVGFVGKTPQSRTFWYLIHDTRPDGSAYFVGYDPTTRRKVGYLARDGYHVSLPPVEKWFSIPYSLFLSAAWEPHSGHRDVEPNVSASRRQRLFLVSGGDLLKVDFYEQTIETVPMPDKVVSLGSYYARFDNKTDNETRIVVRLPAELQILSQQGEFIRSIALSPPMRDQTLALHGVNSDEVIIESHVADDYFAPTTLTWIGADGEPLRQQTVTVRERTARDPQAPWFVTAFIPVPLALGVLSVLSSIPMLSGDRGATDFATNFARLADDFWLPVTLLVLLSLVLAVWAYRRHLGFERRGAAVWAVFVLVLGPLGFLGYLLHREWPHRFACEHCGRSTPRDRPKCLACAEAFEPPALVGSEIFA